MSRSRLRILRPAGPWPGRHACLLDSLPQPPLRLSDQPVPHSRLQHLLCEPLNHITHASCSRALRTLMTSCACHFIPVWGAPVAIHPVLMASLRANKLAHVCREHPVDTSLTLQIPGGQAVTDISSSQGWRCRANRCMLRHTRTLAYSHTYTQTHLHALPTTPSSFSTPQALPTLHRGSSLCGPTALPLATPPPCFHPCSSAMGITSSTCLASIRRHERACQPRRGDPHLQVIRPRSGYTGEGVVVSLLSPSHTPLLRQA